jgi:hypothetical protein
MPSSRRSRWLQPSHRSPFIRPCRPSLVVVSTFRWPGRLRSLIYLKRYMFHLNKQGPERLFPPTKPDYLFWHPIFSFIQTSRSFPWIVPNYFLHASAQFDELSYPGTASYHAFPGFAHCLFEWLNQPGTRGEFSGHYLGRHPRGSAPSPRSPLNLVAWVLTSPKGGPPSPRFTPPLRMPPPMTDVSYFLPYTPPNACAHHL